MPNRRYNMSSQVESMFYAGEVPWHGLGTGVGDAQSSAEAIRLAGLDWDVVQTPVSVNGAEVVGWAANVRTGDGKVLGITSDKYEVVQNSRAFEFVDAIVDGKNSRYETAMSLREGRLVVLLARLGGRKILDDEVAQYLCFANGHDGKTPVRAFDTSTRVVCANTYQMALRGARRVWAFEHSSGVNGRLKMAQDTLVNARAYMDALERRAGELYRQKVSRDQLDRILEQVYGDEKDEEFEGSLFRAKRIVMLKDRLVEIYDNKGDLSNMRGTAWGVYNAFADVAAHARPTYDGPKARERRFLSYVDGNGLLKVAQAAIEAVAA